MSSSNHQRSWINPLGNQGLKFVRHGNLIVYRFTLIAMILFIRNVLLIWENPMGSGLEMHPAFQWLAKLVRLKRKTIRMGDFGAPTQKSSWLYGFGRHENIIQGIDEYRGSKHAAPKIHSWGSPFVQPGGPLRRCITIHTSSP